MFTGIVATAGRVIELRVNPFGARLHVDPGNWTYKPAHGDSVAVNGVCLTYAPAQGDPAGVLVFDVIRETLQQTNLGLLKPGDRVNLESSLTPTSSLGGHFVQGHVDGRGVIARIHAGADEWRVTVQTDAEVMPFIVPKGSIAIDGISLTVATVDVPGRRFEVALIPTTLAMTTLGQAKVGNPVNLETDLINRAVVHALQTMQAGGGVTLEKLRAAGF